MPISNCTANKDARLHACIIVCLAIRQAPCVWTRGTGARSRYGVISRACFTYLIEFPHNPLIIFGCWSHINEELLSCEPTNKSS